MEGGTLLAADARAGVSRKGELMKAMRVAGILALVAATWMVVMTVPDLKRYWRIHNM